MHHKSRTLPVDAKMGLIIVFRTKPSSLPHTVDRPRVPCSIITSALKLNLFFCTCPTSPQSSSQDDLSGVLPSPAESSQLLWLAEVEHILGAASLQLAFTAASKLSSPIPEAHNETFPMGAARSVDATRAHRPWGYGSGPFADVSATGSDIFEKEWGGGAGGKDDVSSSAEIDEVFTIEQLEVCQCS